MRKKSKHSNSDDGALFRNTIGAVKPVAGRRRVLDKPPPKPHAKFSEAGEPPAPDASGECAFDPAGMERGDELEFHRPHITRRILRQLRRGQFAIEDEIDLHGLTAEVARTELHTFIHDARTHGLNCVRVVHGKGLGSGSKGPVLKAGVNHWLSRWDAVAAFCSARPRDGGTGAVYVLLSI
ncbi:MAG: DNA mismatch repair protein MutS [Gammaproteobacteria bacterium]|nr:MAG: DNA mismatch repair protein MutS [Gammaproteobacteria bacterium]